MASHVLVTVLLWYALPETLVEGGASTSWRRLGRELGEMYKSVMGGDNEDVVCYVWVLLDEGVLPGESDWLGGR